MTAPTPSTGFWTPVRSLLIARGVEILLRASVFGLVLSQYTFGGSLLPFTFTYAITYAVFAVSAPPSMAIAERFSGRQLVRAATILLLLLYSALSVAEAAGLTNVWVVGVGVPLLVIPTILIYRTMSAERVKASPATESVFYQFIGDGLEGLTPEIVAGLVLILFGRAGVLTMAITGGILALLVMWRLPQVDRLKAEGTGVTLGQTLNDMNEGLLLLFQHQRLSTLHVSALGANFFLGVISGLLFPLSLLRGNGRPDVFLWIQGGAVLGLLIGIRLSRIYRERLARPAVFFGGFVVSGLLSLSVVGLVAPVGVWAVAYSLLQIASLCAIYPLFQAERSAVIGSQRRTLASVADLVSFSASVIGIATAGIVIERMLTPALAPGGFLEPWLTPWVGTGPAAPIATYWIIGGISLTLIGLIAGWVYARRPVGSVPIRPTTDEAMIAPPGWLTHPVGRTVVAVGTGAAVIGLVAIALAARAGQLYTVALSLCAIVYSLVGCLLLVGWPRARTGGLDSGLTFALIGLGLAAAAAGQPMEVLAAFALPIGATRLPRLSWVPATGAPAPPYLTVALRALNHLGLLLGGVNVLILLGPEPLHNVAIWLTALSLILGGGVFIAGTILRYLATHRSALRTQLGLLSSGAALPLVPAVLGAVILAYALPSILSTAPGWVTTAGVIALMTPATYGFAFWSPPGRVLRLERRLAPLLWVSVVGALYVLSSLALRGWGAPWIIDIALAIAAMILLVIGLREWTAPLARGRASDLERTLLRRPTLEALDHALIDLCDNLSIQGLVLAHEQPGRPGWMLRRLLETDTLTLDEAALPATAPDDCLIPYEGHARRGWLAAPWVAVAQPIRVEDQPSMGCLLLPHRAQPYSQADLRRIAYVAEALASPLQVITLRWAALRPYREREAAQRDERTRIARRLHAEVLQSLAPLPGYLAVAAQRTEDAALRDMLGRQEQEVIKVDDAIRQVVTAIRPASLSAPLALLMEQALRRAATESPATQFHSDIQIPREFDLPVDAKWPAHNIVDNALSNARKHAQARNIWLTLRREGLHLVLVVEDDGVGIPLKEGETDAITLIRNGHFGLADMFDDAEQLNGRLAIGRRMAGGTYVRLWFPVPVA
ncbi:MAG: hypothetical protein JNL73_15325 [Anaerolineales bacterium]|nr:hypothetical protein [Anaerolineales bacterium]